MKIKGEKVVMNKIVSKALEIMNHAECCFIQDLPDFDIGDICTIGDIWDGEGEKPENEYAYIITDSGEDGESNIDIWINYKWDIISKNEDYMNTKIRITDIELI